MRKMESSCKHCYEPFNSLVFYGILCVIISLYLLPVIFPVSSMLKHWTGHCLTFCLNENFRSILVYSSFVIELTVAN
jgi:hypothetical protein